MYDATADDADETSGIELLRAVSLYAGSAKASTELVLFPLSPVQVDSDANKEDDEGEHNNKKKTLY